MSDELPGLSRKMDAITVYTKPTCLRPSPDIRRGQRAPFGTSEEPQECARNGRRFCYPGPLAGDRQQGAVWKAEAGTRRAGRAAKGPLPADRACRAAVRRATRIIDLQLVVGGSMPSNLTSINALDDPDLTGTDTAFRSVCALISARAAADPDRIAVADAAGALTYAELVRRAGRLAARLRAAEVAPGACVGVFLDRSPEFVVAACGILWAGAAYLPVDTTSPRDRVGFVLADADVATVVTSAHHQPRLPEGPWRPLVVDGPGPEGWNSHAAPLAASDPGDLAYVIYTSGSTGRPKGVEITHANLANLSTGTQRRSTSRPSDRASQVAGLGFDAAVWEIWPHLAAGASVHFADDATRRSPQLLRDWLVAAADHHQLRADGARRAGAACSPGRPSTALRTLLTGADALHRRPPRGPAVRAGQQLRPDRVHGRRHVGRRSRRTTEGDGRRRSAGRSPTPPR